MMDFLTGALCMYLLGAIFVLGITESIDEDNPHAPVRLALTWPIVSVLMMLEMLVELLNGKQR
jgi:predicted glycosyltransferase